MALRLAVSLLVWLALWLGGGSQPVHAGPSADAPSGAALPLLQAEAVRATGWHDTEAPTEGWTPVTLPDLWTARWPDFDGVVWYRLHWEQPAGMTEAGLALDYLNMAGAIYLNGTLIGRDPQLVEPLTRAWNTPRHWLLAPPLLREGRNTLLVRVSGIAAYTPGLGPVLQGDPVAVHAHYVHERRVRSQLQLLGLAISTTLAFLFGAFWLMRRSETAYGLFSLTLLCWLGVGINQVVTSPWPFSTTDGWQAFSTGVLQFFAASYAVFTLRFSRRRWPRAEAALWLLATAGALHLWLTPAAQMAVVRNSWTLAAAALLVCTCLTFVAYSLRPGARGQRALAPFMAAVMLATIHDSLAYMGVIDTNRYYAVMAAYVLLLGIALILAARFVHSLQRIENFNTELQAEVNAAREELAATLAQRHALELAHARIGERVNLVSDLHDGLGGLLVGNIARLENAPETLSAPALLALLHSLRDDLRLIIDASGHDQSTPQSLGDLLVPLRHRSTHLLESKGIVCRWEVEGLGVLELPPSQSLDLLRFLQEALTNALKHSGGTQVAVRVVREGDALHLSVQDDGRGFEPDQAARTSSGAGLRSLRARARRLGGALQLHSRPGQTRVALQMPVAQTAAG